ncbi:MAG: peptide ABC transporter permease [Zetaproteobacteria bacterium CG12_big_fil_rev_8_21_14_0_65_54_13]|nr:MAG: peptide ABC transporter permease [Zetaproteobacteria bacterium CG23_combo_of_CG06-09_8_20_14_all_54_7]PIW47299.1 MAG: peptide ABC transporter permease [Zetaproteobacteria bacterium CG12_big_fil_rev_8_21_14_0_65_54_13]PIX54290.1 MAG: peptide ABC transporter permease [Zetaproteobacteria bacterium CG_4_10_14_3_um_filter_54_28]PJA30435.1 MAG: peptide ABC transporter permease [Zetaproteobacteria bacterium CG_4_9_14_3_um_filter_54_145]
MIPATANAPGSLQRLLAHPLILIGGTIVATVALLAVLAPWIAPYDPTNIDVSVILMPPSWQHWCGTDTLGRDIFSRMLYGARVSLAVGFVAVGISLLIGLMLGAVAGYAGGRTDAMLMRATDMVLCFPTFFLILAVIAFLEPSIWNIMIVIGLTSWMGVARLVRAEFLSLRQREFIHAAQGLGVSPIRMMWRYLLPNAMGPVLVSAVLGIAGAVLVESGLSFLGLGVQPPDPSWGNILTEGKDNIQIAWWMSMFPGLAILITVLGYNLLGEGLRDYFDPKLRS